MIVLLAIIILTFINIVYFLIDKIYYIFAM